MRALLASIALVVLSSCATAQTAAEQSLSGEVTAAAPRATFPLRLEAGQIVTLTTSSAENFDTVLTLAGPNGETLAENDDQEQGNLSSRVVHVARASGTYTATVTGFGGATGAFNLNVAFGVDTGLSDAAHTLREERISFTAQRTEMRFDVDLSENDIFVASTFALTEGLDSTLALVDASGAIVAQNDDSGDGSLNSRIVYQAVAAGRYQVVASTYGGEGVGDVMLSLALDPNAEAPFNFASIEATPLARHEGTLSEAQPSQEFRIDLAAGQTLLAISDATSGNLDTVLKLNGPDGFPLAMNDDRGDGSLNSAFAFTAQRAGAYTLVVERFRRSNTSGDFTLTLSSVDRAVVDVLQALAENISLSGPELTIDTQDFRVHYTVEGEDASTPEYARAVADTLQSVLDAQVRRIGWAAPVRDSEGRYRAYVADASGNMGYTKPVQIVFDNPNTANVRESAAARAVLVIENDFRGLNKAAPPESLMRATVTHEFNHVVQFGYDAEEALNWLYEATASWTETTTVGTDQDATDYVETDFAAPQLCWTTSTEGHDYAQWTLLQSLADSYGEGIVVRIWENSVTHDGFDTMTQTLAGVGSTIPEALARWRLQNFARDYALAPLFARAVRLEDTINHAGVWAPKAGIEQLGAHYVALHMQGRYAVALDGDSNLEVFGLGRRDGEIEVVRLGRGGVFDTAGLGDTAFMVFNRAVPNEPGACSAVNYSLSLTPSTAEMAAAQYHFSAAHFTPPT